MPKPKIKICGLLHNAQVVARLNPDFIGFIYYEKSPRYVGDDSSWVTGIETTALKVGVFVNERSEVINEKVVQDGLNVVQLHGSETAQFCKEIDTSVEIIKVFSGEALPSQNEFDNYSDAVDYFLFDHRGTSWGGSGNQFDWEELKRLHLEKPFFISGGIGLDDVDNLLHFRDENFYGIDVNSKFEIEPGRKEIDKLKLFINQIQAKNAISG